jgi:hypothetical protein
MRIPARLLVPALIVVVAVPVAAGPAAADSSSAPLAMTSFARIVVDQAHGHLFLSPGRSGSALTVTDLAGTEVGRSGPIAGATGMALTPDGSSLWVAAAAGDALVRVDTSSLAVVQTVALPAGTCPGDVAVVGARVVYGYSCNTYGGAGSYGGLGVVDATTGVVLANVTTGPYYKPVVVAASGGQVYAGDAGLSPSSLYLYDVTGTPLQLIAARANVGSNLGDLAASPDGTKVVAAAGWPYEHDVYSINKLASAGVYPSGAYPNAASWSGDGQVVAIGTNSMYDTDVRLYAAGSTTPQRTVDFGSGAYLQPRGLAVSADGSQTWAVTGDVYGANLAVRVLSLSAPATSSLNLTASPSAAYPGTTASLAGQLTSAGTPLPGVTLAVSRTVGGMNGGTTTQLASVTTQADGTYSFSDTLPAASGIVAYQTSYAGDGLYAPVSTSTGVTVWSTNPSLVLRLSQPSTGSANVTGIAMLGYAGTDSPGGVTVHLSRAAGGTTVALPDMVTSTNGTVSFADTAPIGTVTYTAWVDANPVHPAASTTAIVGVAVVKLTTALSATASATSTYVGLPVTVSGVLSSAPAALAGNTVTIRRGCNGSNATFVGTVLTGTDGSYAASDLPPEGTCAYQASFAGDSTYAAASASVTVTVQRQVTSLTISAVRGTGSAKKTVTITARLGTTHVNRVVTITATPSGGASVTLASGTVNANGNLVATYQPKTTTTYTATFAGDDWYLPATALVTS